MPGVDGDDNAVGRVRGQHQGRDGSAERQGKPGYECLLQMPQKNGSRLWIRVVGLFTSEKVDGVPVIYAVRHYRADGTDVEKPRAAAWASGGKPLSEDCAAHLSDAFPDAFTVLPQDYVLVKPRFSAFFHTGLDLILRRLGVQTVLLAGTTTPNCIRTTCYDAISLDYDAVVLSDCTSSVTDAVQAGNLADMQRVGAIVCASTELTLA